MKSAKQLMKEITPDDAFEILKILVNDDKKIADKFQRVAVDYLSDVDDIAGEVYYELDNLDVHELWDKSGSTRDGYVDPNELAWEMFEEVLEPFIEEFKKLRKLKMTDQSEQYREAIIKGIQQYEDESTSEFKDWAGDAPGECIAMIREL